MNGIYLLLGSNIEDRLKSLNTAVDAPVRVTMVTMEMKPSCSLIDIRKMASINNWSRGIE